MTIQNDTQLAVTKQRLSELEAAISEAYNNYLKVKAHYDAMVSQRESLKHEIEVYNRYNYPTILVTLEYNRGHWKGEILRNDRFLWRDEGKEDLLTARGIVGDAVEQNIPKGAFYQYTEKIAKGNGSENG